MFILNETANLRFKLFDNIDEFELHFFYIFSFKIFLKFHYSKRVTFTKMVLVISKMT